MNPQFKYSPNFGCDFLLSDGSSSNRNDCINFWCICYQYIQIYQIKCAPAESEKERERTEWEENIKSFR